MDAAPAPWQPRRARPCRAASAAFPPRPLGREPGRDRERDPARPRDPASGVLARPPARARGSEAVASGFAAPRRRTARWRLAARAITELLLPHAGVGEIRLLAPALVAAQRAGRLVMVFDPPAALSAAALAGFGFDVEELLVVHTRARRSRQRQPVGARAGAEERPRRRRRRLAAAALERRAAAPPPARRPRTTTVRPSCCARPPSPAGRRPAAAPRPAGRRRRPPAGAPPQAARSAARGAAVARAADRPVGGSAPPLAHGSERAHGAARPTFVDFA